MSIGGFRRKHSVSLEHYWSILPLHSVLYEKMIFNDFYFYQNTSSLFNNLPIPGHLDCFLFFSEKHFNKFLFKQIFNCISNYSLNLEL